jgi:hypothetical protein
MTRQRTGSAADRRAMPVGTSLRSAGFFANFRANEKFWALSLLLALAFLMGGGSRGDIQSLMYLRPASVLFLAYAFHGLTLEHVGANRLLFAMAGAWVLLVLLQLVPLPPDIWQALPGRGIIAEIDRVAGLQEKWRPLSMAPDATRNAAWAMIAPLAVLVLGVQLDARQLAGLVPVVLSLGLCSVVVGALQILGDPQGPLYFYDITHNGLPVGLFANRNHQAVFLVTLLPMLFVWVKLGEFGRAGADRATHGLRFWPVMGVGAVLLLPLILITGSRSGLAIALLALAVLPFLALGLRSPASGDAAGRSRWALWLLPLALVALAGLSVALGRALSVERLAAGADGEMRLLILPQVLAMIRDYLPLGTGMGTFEAVYQLHEPDGLLRSFYMNHVHDDWLELALAGGIPAVLLVAMAVVAFAVRCVKLIRVSAGSPQAAMCGRLGAVVLVVFALASITDYPLRVPALSCLAAVAVLWMRSPTSSTPRQAHEKIR